VLTVDKTNGRPRLGTVRSAGMASTRVATLALAAGVASGDSGNASLEAFTLCG
jgi:hypothetical protein